MASRNTGLASPPLTPPINGDISYKKKNKNSEMKARPRKEKKDKYQNNRLSYISTTSSVNSTATRSFMSNRRSSTLPDLQNFMPIGPNGERIPVMIPDGSGGLIPYIPTTTTTTKKSTNKKKKSKSSPTINQFSPILPDSMYKIDENKESSTNSSPSTPRPREKTKSTKKKAGRRQSLLIPLNTSSISPISPLTPNSTFNAGDVSTLNNKNVPLFIIPTGPDGKIDPSTLPLPMSSSELMERQKEYEESIIEDSQSFMYSPKKKTSVDRLRHSAYRKNSVSSVKSNLTTPGNFLKGRAAAEEFVLKNKKRGKSKNNKIKIDTASLYSTESNILDGLRYRSESSPSLVKMNQGSESLYSNDNTSEYSSTNFSLKNVESNNSSASFYDEPESEINVNINDSNMNEAFDTLSPDKKDSALLLKKKIDESMEAGTTFKDADLKYGNFNYIANNIHLLPIALHETYRSNLIKIMKKSVQASQHGDTLFLLGNLYTNGFPGITSLELKNYKPNYNKAFNCYFQGYKINHQECSFSVAVCHELGLGTRTDNRKAYQIYQKASTLNHPGAMCRLGLACLNGELGMRVNLKEGVRWLRLSTMYANKEYPQAYYHLSTIYERGIPNLVIRDYKYAIQLLEKASDLGHIPSQHKLGLCYEYGRLGVEVDAKISMKYFGLAAARGHGESMFELAGWYLTGSEVYKDENKEEVEYIIEPSNETAFQWTRKAAERNLPKAEFAIGYFYDNGIGINKDPEEAMKWYYVANVHKDPKAIQKMSEKSSVYWINQFKPAELKNIENEIYSRQCNYDLIEDELNLHFVTESFHETILNCDTIKSNDKDNKNNNNKDNSNSNLSNSNSSSTSKLNDTSSVTSSKFNTPTSKNDKCLIM
ncbi:HCP-like protein [Anaeromyces robustus]|uniref:HCP-like protein n=1 Tax=Anaeromyces robustus TaxID=1754192 RepID=A0A1Y1W4F6_9FUNG|nr:HCP-like protein [Anaeromyces robustus]|eukprot:ORX68453.1 HCP-like protein [Anaeromyces robustus]